VSFPSDNTVYLVECVLLALAVGGYVLWLLVAGLRRLSPELHIGLPIAVAFGVRVVAALFLGQLSIAQQLRGGDELGFLDTARDLAAGPLTSEDSIDKLTGELHTFLFSLDLRIFDPDPPLDLLRVEMITLSVVGLVLLTAAVYELAGPRAARIAAWVLAFEPAGVFFSSLLHKEPLMFLAEGAVVYGGAVFWKRGRLAALLPIIVGCLVAVATRPYAGWFLAAAAAVVVLHASITRQEGARALVLTATVLALIAAFVPVVWNASSDKSLEGLQSSQDANAADRDANLSLERVDYSTRAKLITNLPQRISDVILKPYPWRTQNTSQRLGVLGTLVMLFAVGALLAAVFRSGRAVMQRAGPLIYPALFMLVAYSLSAGNAGTAFRYRTHVVEIVLCAIVVLWVGRREERRADRPAEPVSGGTREREPILAG